MVVMRALDAAGVDALDLDLDGDHEGSNLAQLWSDTMVYAGR